MKKRLVINFLTSKIFWESIPLIITEIAKREHFLYIFDQDCIPSIEKLLNCDVLIDMSAIIDVVFYEILLDEYNRIKSMGHKVPLLVDNPEAIMNSMDKRKTHRLIPDLSPESYNLDGQNNIKVISMFKDDEYVVIKEPMGWQAQGIEKLSLKEALKKYGTAKDLIVQKYIPFNDGVGRILTLLNHRYDFLIMCAYLRIPDSWRTGVGTTSRYEQVDIDDKLTDFARDVAIRSGLYLNGIDYIYSNGRYVLIEVNAAPGIRDPYDEFKIDTPKILLDHIERNVNATD